MKNPNAPRPETIECEISINHSEVIFDVRNITHKIGRSHFSGDNFVNVAVIQADESPQDMELLAHFMKRRITDLCARMTRYFKGSETKKEVDNVGREYLNTIIALALPDNWQENNEQNLQTAAYNYVVNACVSDFLTNANARESVIYAEKADMELDLIKYYISARKPGTMRRHRHFVG